MSLSEVCKANRVIQSPEEMWDPNEISSKKDIVWDWRGRCIQKPDFVRIGEAKNDDLVKIGAPLLTCVSASGFRDENCFHVEEAFLLISLFQEYFRSELNFVPDKTVKTFSVYSVMSLIFRDRGAMSEAMRFQNTCKAVRSFISSRTMPSKEIKKKWQNTMNIRRKSAKDSFSSVLDFNSIFAIIGNMLMMKLK